MPQINVGHANRTESTTITGNDQNRVNFPQSNLTNGNRYLCLWKSITGPGGSRTVIELAINGVKQPFQRGERASGFSSSRLKQISGMFVFTAGSAGTVQILGSLGTGTERSADEQIVCIDLDDALVENTDWIYDENNTTDLVPQPYGNELQKASVTFTPDGTSDYLVIGHLKWGNSATDDRLYRLRDQTNNVTLAETGPGGGNIGNEEQCDVLMHVLSAPPATPITIDTEYQSFAASNKERAAVFVLRLSAFDSYGFIQTDLNSAPPNTNLNSIGSFQVTPSSDGRVVMLSSFMGQSLPGFEQGWGYRGTVEYGGVVRSDITNLGGSAFFVAASGGPPFAEAQVGPAFFRRLISQPVAPTTVEGFIEGNTTNPVHLLRRTQTLVAFAPETSDVTPPVVTNRSPAPLASGIVRDTTIAFDVTDPDSGVNLGTLDVLLTIDGGPQVEGVKSGQLRHPFDGPSAQVQAISDGYNVVMDFRGFYPSGSIVTVLIAASNGAGTPMTPVNYSFTMGAGPEPEPLGIVQEARG